MPNDDAATYGDRIAGIYDDLYGAFGDEGDAVSLLAELAGDGRALELGIGTGRIALPLAARGVAVRAIDASDAMVARLRAKPGGDAIPVTIGDFADLDGVDDGFALAFVVFNTFFGLPSQEDQVRCFANVAARLADGGRFLIEAFVPDVGRYARGNQTTTVERIESDRVVLALAVHDPVGQTVRARHVVLGAGGIELFPVHLRYAWPAELDLMARLAGLEREHRWGGWNREPFTAGSGRHVSVYRRPTPDGGAPAAARIGDNGPRTVAIGEG